MGSQVERITLNKEKMGLMYYVIMFSIVMLSYTDSSSSHCEEKVRKHKLGCIYSF